jgi:hypothetical protein
MKTLSVVTLLMFAASMRVFAPVGVPEIDPTSTGTALVLLTTATLIIRSRRKH